MVCFYHSSCIEFSVALVGCQVEYLLHKLHHFYHKYPDLLNGIPRMSGVNIQNLCSHPYQ